MTDYLITMESAWIIHDARSLDDAIAIAIGEAGKRLNPTAKYVEIETGQMGCPYCEESLNCALVVANTGLVGLVLEMKVFKAESEEHAQRIAKSVVGKALRDVPLKILETRVIGEPKSVTPAPSKPEKRPTRRR
jgi:uncharacterized protein (UPF0212 family)